MADTLQSSDIPQVHGMVVVNPDGSAVGAPVGGATSANQTNGTQKTQIVDAGGEVATVTGGKLDVNLAGEALPVSGATEGVAVAIVDGSGNQITSFGGGTQYAEGANIATTPTGTVAVVRDGSNIARPLKQPLEDGGSVSVSNHPAEFPLPAAQVSTLTPPAAITGFATAALQLPDGHNVTVDNASLAVTGTFWQATQPVSGTVTANLSATDNAVLDVIETNTDFGTVVSGGTETGALRVTLANNSTGVLSVDDNGGSLTVDGTVAVSGTVTVDLGVNNDVTVTSGTITANLGATDNAVLDAIEVDTTSIDAKTPALGQGLMAASSPVVIASNQSAVPVTLTSTTVTGTVAVTQSGTWDEVGINDSGNSITVDAPVGTPAFVRLSDGASAITTLPVSLASVPSHPVTNAGTFAVQAAATLAAETTKVIGTVNIASGQSVGTVETAPTTVLNGNTTVTTAGTRVALTSSTACKSVTVKALAANTGIIYVGSSTVAAANGYALVAGDSVSLDIANLNTVYIDSSVNSEGVTYLGVN